VERRDRRRKGAEKPDATEKTDKPAAAKAVKTAKPATSDTTPAEDASSEAPAAKTRASKPAARPATKKTEAPVNDANNTPTADDVAAEAEKFLKGLVDALGLEGTTSVRHDGEDIEVNLDGENLGVLIGPRGNTLLAVQDIVRVASQRRIGDHTTRLRLDIMGYREKRRAALERFANEQADAVAASGEERILEPMPSADRKVIHDTLSGRTDVVTRSEGEDPKRRVVIASASSAN
jgi:spoIIIJ-associated protein